ncbi:retrovirus-related pol polyprotein from transposon TNT 1-94 [Tanacetum coccineum]
MQGMFGTNNFGPMRYWGPMFESLYYINRYALESTERQWIKDNGCSKHMTGNRKLFSTYKVYNEGNIIFGSNIRGIIIGKGYSQNSKAYIILNKHTRKVEESLNVTFDETPPPSKTSPLVDDDLDEEEAIKVTAKKNLENDIVYETLEIDEIVNIKESRNHPLENISTIEPKNVNKALGEESWIVAMQEELNQFVANNVWELVPQPKNMTIILTKWVFRKKLGEKGGELEFVREGELAFVLEEFQGSMGKSSTTNARCDKIVYLLLVLLEKGYFLDRDKVLLVEAQGFGKVLNEEELEFLADRGVIEGPVTQTVITHNVTYQADDLDAYDSDCDDFSTAKAVLMANLSSYGSNVLSEDNLIANESLSAELERYKEQVKLLEERQNADLNFGKHFIPQQELSDEQAFQLQTSHPNTDQSASSPVKIEAPRELPKITPDALTEGEWGSMFDARHELCFLKFVSDMNARITFTLVRNACPLIMITATKKLPLREPIPLEVIAKESVVTKVYTRRPKVPKTNGSNSKPKIAKSVIYNKMEPGTSWGSNTSVALSSSSSVDLRLSKLFCGI